ncbi:hypothetical protein D3C80_1116950 [compost metagenome]
MLPFLGRNLRQRLHDPDRPGIIDGDIETAEDALGRVRKPVMGFGNTGIARHRMDAAAGLANFSGDLFQSRSTPRIDNDSRPLSGEQLCRRPTDAG